MQGAYLFRISVFCKFIFTFVRFWGFIRYAVGLEIFQKTIDFFYSVCYNIEK